VVSISIRMMMVIIKSRMEGLIKRIEIMAGMEASI